MYKSRTKLRGAQSILLKSGTCFPIKFNKIVINNVLKKSWHISTDCQIVWTQIRPDVLSGMTDLGPNC